MCIRSCPPVLHWLRIFALFIDESRQLPHSFISDNTGFIHFFTTCSSQNGISFCLLYCTLLKLYNNCYERNDKTFLFKSHWVITLRSRVFCPHRNKYKTSCKKCSYNQRLDIYLRGKKLRNQNITTIPQLNRVVFCIKVLPNHTEITFFIIISTKIESYKHWCVCIVWALKPWVVSRAPQLESSN